MKKELNEIYIELAQAKEYIYMLHEKIKLNTQLGFLSENALEHTITAIGKLFILQNEVQND